MYSLVGPVAIQQEADEGCHVADVDIAIVVAVGSRQVDARSVAVQLIGNQGRHIADVDAAVAVHVAALGLAAGNGLPGVIIPIIMVDSPILCVGLADLGGSDDIPLVG